MAKAEPVANSLPFNPSQITVAPVDPNNPTGIDLSLLTPLFLKWYKDPVAFVRDTLKATPEPWQAKALMDLAKHNRVAVRSGHGVGKSAMQSWVILWYLFTRSPVKIACTAPTSHQLYDVLWSEVSKWARQLPQFLQQQINIKSDRIELTSNPEECFAVARTARKEQPEAFQGFHSDNMMFLIDEASGVEDIIFEVGEGAMSTPGAKALMCGNPTRTSGYFYDAFHRMRKIWQTHRVSCEDSSRVSKEYVETQALKYGVDSNVFRVRVLGEFPMQDDDVVVGLALAEAAANREVETVGRRIWGLDVARFGSDRTALCIRQGNTVPCEVRTWRNKDTMQVVGIIKHLYEEAEENDEAPDVIIIDVIGIGAGVVDRMYELGLPAVGINVAESAAIGEKFMRLRDELWWRAREWFEKRDCKIVDDEALIGELASVRYGIQSNGKIKVESKDDMRKRGLPSPDVADAFVLTFSDVGRVKRKLNRSKRTGSWRIV